jgi:hypothetical protein
MTDSDPEIIYSEHCCDLMFEGHRLELHIYKTEEDPAWVLETVNEFGTSTVWDEVFISDGLALRAFEKACAEEGLKAFLTEEELKQRVH